MIITIFTLLVVYQLKHLLADYFLQGEYMLRKFLGGWAWIGPLAAHCGVHAMFSFLIGFYMRLSIPQCLVLAYLDFSLHAMMDRIKAAPDLLGRFKPLTKDTYQNATPQQKFSNRWFWWSLGIDQTFHHLTHYGLIYLIITGKH